MNQNNPKIDLNTASREELTQIPGIGRQLAERIIQARPFSSIEDLRRVSGVGQVSLARFAPYLSVSTIDAAPTTEYLAEEAIEAPVQSEQPPTTTPEAPPEVESREEEGVEAETEEPTEEAFEAPPSPPRKEAQAPSEADITQPQISRETPSGVTQSEMMAAITGSSLITFVISIVLTLGILALLNGGLRFVRPAELAELRTQVSSLQSQSALLEENMQTLRTRMDNLEGLGGRISNLETQVSAINRDMTDLSTQIAAFNEQLVNLASQVEELQARTNGFQAFLEGLQQLLNEVLP